MFSYVAGSDPGWRQALLHHFAAQVSEALHTIFVYGLVCGPDRSRCVPRVAGTGALSPVEAPPSMQSSAGTPCLLRSWVEGLKRYSPFPWVVDETQCLGTAAAEDSSHPLAATNQHGVIVVRRQVCRRWAVLEHVEAPTCDSLEAAHRSPSPLMSTALPPSLLSLYPAPPTCSTHLSLSWAPESCSAVPLALPCKCP